MRARIRLIDAAAADKEAPAASPFHNDPRIPQLRINNMIDFNIFLQGGGTRLPVHIGAVKALEQGGARAAAWSGVSGGSLVASLFASGYTSDQATELMLETDFARLLDPSPESLRPMGLYAGHRLERWLNRLLEGRTFGDLQAPLAVLATDVATGAPFVFSDDATPHVKLSTAIRCSISLPGVFTIPRVGGRALIDGCFASVTPQMLFPDTDVASVVVRIHESEPAPKARLDDLSRHGYVLHIADMVLRNLKPLSHPELWDYHVRVPVGSMSSLNFDLSSDRKQELFDRGYNACREALADAMLDFAGPSFADAYVLTEDISLSDTAVDIDATSVLK